MVLYIMIYVFDTSTIIYDPTIVSGNGYENSRIVIPLTVIKELDNIKSQDNSKGYAAREAVRRMDDVIEKYKESHPDEKSHVHDIPLENGSTLSIELNHIKDTSLMPLNADLEAPDDYIRLVALNIQNELQDENVVLVTQDKAMDLIAQSWGIKTHRHISMNDNFSIPTGVEEYEPLSDEIEQLYDKNFGYVVIEDEKFPMNSGVIVSSGNASALTVAHDDTLMLVDQNIDIAGIKPHGARQIIAANLLSGFHAGDNPEEFLGSLSGRAGSGKTLLAVASGIQSVADGKHEKVMIFRPTMPVSKTTDLGFLPGDLDDKLSPWKSAIDDVVEFIAPDGYLQDGHKHVDVSSVVSVEPINFVRGRGFRNAFVIIDEAQNCEPHVIKTLLSRLGRGSCAVMTWDPGQIDNPYISHKVADGPMSALRQTFGHPMVWHMELRGAERGGVSALID